ncbi:hypothetical protein ACFONG_16835 [Uliginosibacterium paludis]|uniref:Uncharacterized protein n=1 Tax=Uliginosibacterium paludis TaxID=1615952 RepID=A0ABV2CU70_9RHOO
MKAVFEDMVWPFDIGASPDAAPLTEDPLGLLHEVLWQKMHDSLMNPRQRRRTEIAVRYRGTPELPEELSAHLQQLLLRGLERLIVMLNLAYERGELRRGLNPVGVAQSLVAACIGVVVEHMNNPQADLIHSFSFAPGLVLLGAGRHLNPR